MLLSRFPLVNDHPDVAGLLRDPAALRALGPALADPFRDRGVTLASVDVPDIPGLPPSVDLVTSPLAYVRLHGRNGETWWGSDAATRYDYCYNDAELRAWVERIEAMTSKTSRILVYFNNHWKGQAPQNAGTLKEMLRGKELLR